MKQTTNSILLVRPASFFKNEKTAVNNYFQQNAEGSSIENLTELAREEFDGFSKMLKKHHINTQILQDTEETSTPDSIFPNNVISFHGDTFVLYPMFAPNRRLERDLILSKIDTAHKKIFDLTGAESEGRFLEGTGSLILDRQHSKAYCSLSDRADPSLVHEFCLKMGYVPVIFQALQTVDDLRLPIYHTNVMLSIGTKFAVICLDSIDNVEHRDLVVNNLKIDGKEIVEISEEQMKHFCGNILEVRDEHDNPFIVMSTQAYGHFTHDQIKELEKYGKIIHSALGTIEMLGGGSARCMITEVF